MTDEERTLSPRRLEAFSDGVFAIAATLLVLDLSVENLGAITSNDQLWRALGSISESLLSFVISFLLLCMLWMVHARQFEHVVRVDNTVLWLNCLRLLGVVLIPFTTSLNADFSGLLLGRLVLPLNFLFVLVLGWALWGYVSKRSRGLLDQMSDAAVRSSGRRALGAVIAGLVVVLLAPFIGSWAFLAFAVSPLTSRRS
ncbi:TMEM175 family protein [Microterricola viridarii]|uniref:Uncharacterized membrane protein n=1 Tax=Microterricola viridarii TaxID=412690 RepID=A0A1H1UHW8_9MICO|nr:TMEM175 family protein [Microterricola viridarii]SDS72048.1 Uncharacterized membrane protein [Microterricola viridarii]